MQNNGSHADPLGDRLMSIFWLRPPATVGERARRRISLHLIPVLFALYVLAYLDRVNVSVAQLGMKLSPSLGGLGFQRDVIGFGAGLFFWGYWILEIPSTLSVVRWGARWVFCRILVLWGLCATLVGFIGLPAATYMFGWLPHLPVDISGMASIAGYVNGLRNNPAYQFYFFRFLLGFFEGGFFPSVIVYLSYWFRGEDRAKAIASFMAAIPLSSVLGSPVSGLLLGVHWLGLAGWRWIFIVEGVLPMIAGIAVLFLLPDRPEKAAWLPDEERLFIAEELAREHRNKQAHGHGVWLQHLGMVLLLTAVYFCLNVSSYGLSMFLPAIIQSQSGLSSQNASYLATLPYIMALLAMLVNGWHSDRTGERILHVAVPVALSGIGLFVAARFDQVGLVAVPIMIFWVGTFLYAHLPAFWPIPTMFLGSAAAASAIGFINMVGNLGGFYGPLIVGELSSGTTSFGPALEKIAPWPIYSAVIILLVGLARRWQQRRTTDRMVESLGE